MDNNFMIAQGWQCPICGRIYNPSTPMCYFCNNGNSKGITVTCGVDYGKGESKCNDNQNLTFEQMKTNYESCCGKPHSPKHLKCDNPNYGE